jgi:predicted CopG family antitoxin
MSKPVKIEDSVHKDLSLLKIECEAKTLSDVIKQLIKEHKERG